MATKERIFEILAGASAALGRKDLEEQLGESYRSFQTQLDRWVKQELIFDTGEHHYMLTDKGRAEALQEDGGGAAEELVEGGEGGEVKGKAAGTGPGLKIETQHTAQTTERHQFFRLGRSIGVIPANLIEVTTEHIWSGGDYQDLKWVAKGLQDMGIQRDLANRWFHAWASHLKQPLPTDLPNDFRPPEERKTPEELTAAKKEGIGLRSYTLTPDNIPIYVGPHKGDMDYGDVMELAKIRAQRGSADGHQASAGSMADEITKIFTAFKAMTGEQTVGKSWVVKPGEEGYTVEEVDPSKPVVLPQAAAAKAGPSYYIDQDGATREIQPGQPIVIVKEAPRPVPAGQQYLIDQRTGAVQEVIPGQPIIIKTEPAQVSQATPLQMKDANGNDIILDINTYIRLEEHKEKQKQNEETHQIKLEIAKGFKDLLKNAQTALSHMGEEGA